MPIYIYGGVTDGKISPESMKQEGLYLLSPCLFQVDREVSKEVPVFIGEGQNQTKYFLLTCQSPFLRLMPSVISRALFQPQTLTFQVHLHLLPSGQSAFHMSHMTA